MVKKTLLIVLLGPTGVGKTNISLRLAQHLECPIVSSDSRQFYRELKIGTATPTEEQLSCATHYFIGSHSIFDTYSAGQYELDAVKLLNNLFENHKTALLVGGSMMYIDAVCNGIDDIPTVDEATRAFWWKEYEEKGLDYIRQELERLDPKHYHEQVDQNNAKRIIHALEICSITGKPFSNIRTGKRKERDFDILKIGLTRPREELYERINKRVDEMMLEGLLAEAVSFYKYKHLNTLNTVGYKELFDYMDEKCSLEQAVEWIKRDTRHYAKKQLTWFKRDETINWFCPDEEDKIIEFCSTSLHQL
jgi:tRNA dimethylallyltransferase